MGETVFYFSEPAPVPSYQRRKIPRFCPADLCPDAFSRPHRHTAPSSPYLSSIKSPIKPSSSPLSSPYLAHI